jgi:hypothetical protein
MDTEVYKVQPPRLCYEVQFNPGAGGPIQFERFSDALAYYRGYLKGQASAGRDDGPRIVNIDRHDGSPDGNYGGLTDDERAAIEEVDP